MIHVWHTGHEINEKISHALHAGIPDNILKHTEFAENYFKSSNKQIAVGYGILRGTGDIFRHNEQHGVDYYEVDRGYINPNHFDGYYRISKNGMQAKYEDIDYPSDRLKKLKYKRENWYNPKGRIIVCPPSDFIKHYYGLTVGDEKPLSWLSHCKRVLEDVGLCYKIREKSDHVPLINDLKDARGVVTFNSNVAVDALIKGIPVFATSHDSIVNCYSWMGELALVPEAIIKMTPPSEDKIEKLLRFISYNQFTLEEIRNGSAWRLLHE